MLAGNVRDRSLEQLGDCQARIGDARKIRKPSRGSDPLEGWGSGRRAGRGCPARRTRDRARAHRARAGRRGRVAPGGEGRPEPSSRRRPRGRSGRRGTWRVPGCVAPGPSQRPRAARAVPCAGPLGPRPAPRRAGAAASRDAARGRRGRGATRRAPCGRRSRPRRARQRAPARTRRGDEACRSSACRAPPAPCRRPRSAHRRADWRSGPRAWCGACSNAAVTLSVEIPSALAREAAKSSRRLPSSLWWKSRSACASLSGVHAELVGQGLESRRLPSLHEDGRSAAPVFARPLLCSPRATAVPSSACVPRP